MPAICHPVQAGGGVGDAVNPPPPIAPIAVPVRLLRDRTTWLVLFLALVLRLAVWGAACWNPEHRYTDDSLDYIALASTLAADGEFALRDGRGPEIGRVPGYPAFLVFFVAIFQEPANCIALFQVLLDTATVLLVMLACNQHLPRPQVLVAGTLYALSLTVINAANLVLSETLFIFAIACVLALSDALWRAQGRLRLWTSGPVGLILGASVLIRVVSLPLLVPLAVWAAWKGPARDRLLGLFFCMGGFALPIGGWMVRNHAVGAEWCISTTGDTMLLICNAAQLEAHTSHRAIANVRAELLQEADKRARAEGDTSPVAVARMHRRMAMEILSRQPIRAALYLLGRNVLNLMPDHVNLLRLTGLSEQGKSGTLSTLRRDGVFKALCQWFALKEPSKKGLVSAFVLTTPFLLLQLATYLLAALGCVNEIRRREFAFLLLLLVPIMYLLIVPAGGANPRYGAPAMPFICILAACSPWPWRRKTLRAASSEDKHAQEVTSCP
jgi:hypothetical protein